MSETWQEVTVAGTASRERGSFTDGDWIEAPHIRETGIRLVQTGNVGVGTFVDRSKKYISQESFDSLRCKEVLPGDILICRLADPIGRACFAPDYGERMITSVDVAILRVDHDQFDPRYVVYTINTSDFLRRCELASGGTTRQRISRSNLGSLKFRVPALARQQRIAEILSTIDEAIEQTEALIAKFQSIKAGLMHDLFMRGVTPDGKLRPPRDEAPHLYKESPLGWIPKEWEVDFMKSMGSPSKPYLKTGPFGSSLKIEHWVEYGRPVITIGALGEGVFHEAELLHVSEITAARLREYQLVPGDIVFSRVADVGRSAAIKEEQAGWIMSSNLMRISLDTNNVIPDFFQGQLAYDSRVRLQIRASVNAGGRDVANSATMNALRFFWPPYDEQERIVERLKSVADTIARETDVVAQFQKQKRGLMHDLLSGKVRVPVPNDEKASANV